MKEHWIRDSRADDEEYRKKRMRMVFWTKLAVLLIHHLSRITSPSKK